MSFNLQTRINNLEAADILINSDIVNLQTNTAKYSNNTKDIDLGSYSIFSNTDNISSNSLIRRYYVDTNFLKLSGGELTGKIKLNSSENVSRVLISNSNKEIITSEITTLELTQLDGIIGNIQEQFDNITGKVSSGSALLNNFQLTIDNDPNKVLYCDSNRIIKSTGLNYTMLSYIADLTGPSTIQTQLYNINSDLDNNYFTKTEVNNTTKSIRGIASQDTQGYAFDWNDPLASGNMKINCYKGLGHGGFDFQIYGPPNITGITSLVNTIKMPNTEINEELVYKSFLNSDYNTKTQTTTILNDYYNKVSANSTFLNYNTGGILNGPLIINENLYSNVGYSHEIGGSINNIPINIPNNITDWVMGVGSSYSNSILTFNNLLYAYLYQPNTLTLINGNKYYLNISVNRTYGTGNYYLQIKDINNTTLYTSLTYSSNNVVNNIKSSFIHNGLVYLYFYSSANSSFTLSNYSIGYDKCQINNELFLNYSIPNKVLISDSNKNIISSSLDSTKLFFLSDMMGPTIQTQLNDKGTITGFSFLQTQIDTINNTSLTVLNNTKIDKILTDGFLSINKKDFVNQVEQTRFYVYNNVVAYGYYDPSAYLPEYRYGFDIPVNFSFQGNINNVSKQQLNYLSDLQSSPQQQLNLKVNKSDLELNYYSKTQATNLFYQPGNDLSVGGNTISFVNADHQIRNYNKYNTGHILEYKSQQHEFLNIANNWANIYCNDVFLNNDSLITKLSNIYTKTQSDTILNGYVKLAGDKMTGPLEIDYTPQDGLNNTAALSPYGVSFGFKNEGRFQLFANDNQLKFLKYNPSNESFYIRMFLDADKLNLIGDFKASGNINCDGDVSCTALHMMPTTNDRVARLYHGHLIESGVNYSQLLLINTLTSDAQTQLNNKAESSVLSDYLKLNGSNFMTGSLNSSSDYPLYFTKNVSGSNKFVTYISNTTLNHYVANPTNTIGTNYMSINGDNTAMVQTIKFYTTESNVSPNAFECMSIEPGIVRIYNQLYVGANATDIQTQINNKLNLTGGTITGLLYLNNGLNVKNNIMVENEGNLFIGAETNNALRFHHNSGNDSYIDYGINGLQFRRNNGSGVMTNSLYLDNTGKALIGDCNGFEQLNVGGTINIQSPGWNSKNGIRWIQSYPTNTEIKMYSCLDSTGLIAQLRLRYYRSDLGFSANSDILTIQDNLSSSKYIGINNIDPSYTLDVGPGNLRVRGITSANTDGRSIKVENYGHIDIVNQASSRKRLWISENGKVGVNISGESPSTLLQLDYDEYLMLNLNRISSAAGYGCGINFSVGGTKYCEMYAGLESGANGGSGYWACDIRENGSFGGGSYTSTDLYVDKNGTNAKNMVIRSGGYQLYDSTTDNYRWKTRVSGGSFYFDRWDNIQYSVKGQIDSDGVYIQYSDFTLKEAIELVNENKSLNKILQTNIYAYNFKDSLNKDRKKIGVISQEVAKYNKHCIYECDDKLTIAYNDLFCHNILAVKAINKKIEKQEKEINELKLENILLKEQFNELERKIALVFENLKL